MSLNIFRKKIERIRKVLVITVINFFLMYGLAYALPEGMRVESGSVQIEQSDAGTLNITAADKSVINFNSFNIGTNEAVHFIQPSAESSVLSRVIGNSASQINGSLTANGILFLTNSNGINFGATANVKVNSMIASTLDITTNNFINGNYVFDKNSNSVFARILNEGMIEGNNIALVGSAVENRGIITARVGTVNLAAGDKVTVSIDTLGLIQVEITEEVSGKVYDENGVAIKDAIANSGTIEAGQVYMSVKTADDIFESAVNTSGIVKANEITQSNGVIKIWANKFIQVSGSMITQQGIEITSEDFINIRGEFRAAGDVVFSANKGITVNADITVENGNLEFRADADKDGIGAFNQVEGAFICTAGRGDIIIEASGESRLGNIESAGDVILKSAAGEAVYTQRAGTEIKTAGSLEINQGVTLKANDGIYNIGKDWINLGVFESGYSTLNLVTTQTALVLGANIFYNFSVNVPEKIVKFESERTQEIRGVLTLRGEYGKLLVIGSTESGKQWKINPQGETDIMYVLASDSINIRGPPLKAIHTSSAGNLFNWDTDPYWTGEGSNNNWSNSNNWDTGTIPTASDIVTFDGITGTNPNKYSIIDELFQGTIAQLTIDGYTGTITLERDLTVTGDITLLTGSVIATLYHTVQGKQSLTITVAGNWSNSGGSFEAGTSTVVFNDASKASTISGNNTFYNFECITPAKEIYFEAGRTYTFKNNLHIEGADGGYNIVYLRSSQQGIPWYINVEAENYTLSKVGVGDSHNIGKAILTAHPASNFGNNTVWNLNTVLWTGITNNLWSESGNWSGGTPAGQAVEFTSGAVASSIDTAYTGASAILSLTINGYTGTITQAAALEITGNYAQSTGTFTGASQAITVGGNFTLSGGTFTSTSGTLSAAGNWTHTDGIFTHNSGTVAFNGSGTQVIGYGVDPFYNVTYSGSGTLQLKPSWSYQQKITISYSMVANTNQTDFPVLIKILDENNPLFTTAQSDGDDIVFTGADGTKLSHEIEVFTTTAGSRVLWAWVKIPTLSASSDTVVYMHYGNAVCASQQNASVVWSSSYAGVWHMPNGTTLSGNDSTSNNNDGTVYNAVAGAGQIDGAGSFDGAGDCVDMGNGASISNMGQFTIEHWIKIDSFPVSGSNEIINKYLDYLTRVVVGNRLHFYVYRDNLASSALTSSVLSTDTWYHVVAAFDSTLGSNQMKLFINGSFDNQMDRTGGPSTGNEKLYLGVWRGNDSYFTGILDETSISSVARSADWITTEYRNQSAPATYETAASQEAGAIKITGAFTTSGTNTVDNAANNPSLDIVGAVTAGSGTTYTKGTGSIYLTGGAANINFNSKTIEDLIINSSATKTLTGALTTDSLTVQAGTLSSGANNVTVSGNVVISGGTLTAPSNTLTVGGNWLHTSGTFTHNSGTVDFNGSGTQDIAYGSDAFYNLTHSGAGTVYVWPYRKTVTIDRTKVSSTQTDFPVLLYINGDTDLYARAQSDGDDLVFIGADGTRLAHEIEYYSRGGSSDTAYIWVKIPTLLSSANTVFYMNYGNAVCSSQQNATAVWDSNYKGVWHLPNGTTLSALDSTSNDNDGAITGATAGAGQIDGAGSFDGSGDYVNVGNGVSYSSGVTYEAWIKPTVVTDWSTIARKYCDVFRMGTAGKFHLVIDANDWTGHLSLGTISAGSWYFLTATVDNSSHSLIYYINGAFDSNPSYIATIAVSGSGSYPLYIGANSYPGQEGGDSFNGIIDETRISSTARSANWIATEYANQNSPATFSSIGSQTANTLTLANNLTQSGSGTMNAADASLAIGGNISVSAGTLNASSANCNLDVAGNVTVTAGTLSAPAVADDTSFTVAGNWEVSGTGIFTPNAGRVVFDASTTGKTIVTTSSGADDFYDIKFNNAAGSWTASDSLETTNFTLTAGTFVAPATTLTVAGNWIYTAGTFTHNSGTVTFNATTTGKTITTGNQYFYNVLFNGAGGEWTLQDDFYQSGVGATAFTAGTLNLNGKYYVAVAPQAITLGNGFTLNVGTGGTEFGDGTLAVGTGSTVTVSSGYVRTGGLTISGTGTFTCSGSAIIAAYYNVNITSPNWNPGTSTLVQDYFTPRTLYSTQPLYNYQVGGASSWDVTVTLNSNLTIQNNFSIIAGTGGTRIFNASSYTMNVGGNWDSSGGTFTAGTSTVTFDSTATGKTINPGASSFYNIVFNGIGGGWTEITNNITVTNNLTITNGTYDLAALDLAVTGNLLINGGTLDADNADCDLDINGNVTVSSGTLSAPAVADDTSFTAAGNWEVSGTGIFTPNAGRVVFDAGATGKTIVTTSSGTDDFYDIKFNNAAGGWTASDSLETTNFILTAGTFTAPATTLIVAGNWTHTDGTFTHNSGTVTFNGTGTQVISYGVDPFYNVTYSGSGTLQLDPSWSYQQKITISYSMVANTNQTDFPVLIKILDENNPLFTTAQADGDDIVFTGSDGTKLSHEIEVFTTTAGSRVLWAWVKIPTLSASSDTVVYMHYGNASCASQQNAGAVWSSSYSGVWHLPNGTTLGALDSTSNNNDGTITGATAVAGQIDGAGSFDGNGDYVDCGTGTSLNPASQITVETWIKISSDITTVPL